MIYIKNNTEIQTIFIPRTELQSEAYNATIKTYEDGYKDGFGKGKQYQKDQLLNLYVTENGEYEREDGWGIVTVDIPKGDCPEGGSCNLGEGEIYLTANDAGFYELYAADDGYDGWSKFYVTLENAGAIKINKASELLDIFNNGEQIDYGAYYYVGGKITDIAEVNTYWGNATYILDNGFKIYRGKWFDGNPFWDENQIKVGAYIVVYGVIAEYRGTLQFNAGSQVIAYQECEGGEIVSCNLEDKWVTPSMGERDNNGYIVVEESEGFDGLSRVVIDPQTIYNEGVSAGKAEGSDLILGAGDIYLTPNERGQKFEIYPSDWEYDAFDKFIVELEDFEIGGDANIYDALYVHQLLMDGNISYGNTYLFKGEITEIQRIRPDYGDARYTLDGSLNVYNGQTMGYDLQVGDNVIVVGTLSEYNGEPQLSAGSMIKAWWREGGSGNCDDAYNNGYNDGYGNGYNDGQANCEGGSCNLINPIFFSETEGNTINAEGVEIPTFVYEGNQHYNVWPLNMAENEEFNVQIRFQPWNGGYEEPVNIFGCEDTDWDSTTFGARIYMGTIYFRMSGDDISYPYNESAWYDVEMGYNSSKRWIIVNGETLLETGHAWFTKPSQNFMIGAINSGGNAFRPFYGKIAATYINANGSQVWLLPKEDGHMDVYWDDRSLPWVPLSGENNARFESDWMSGDGMKTITWLGKKEAPRMNEYGGVKYGNSTFTYFQLNIDDIGDYSYMFEDCKKLEEAPSINSPVYNPAFMFSGCENLTNGGNYDTSMATNLKGMYAGCENLRYVGALDCSSLPNDVVGWDREAQVFNTYQYPNLTDFEGFINLKQTVNLMGLIALNEQSVINVFNGLYDFNGNGETPNSIQGKLTMSRFITDLVEQYRAIAENKGWTITIE